MTDSPRRKPTHDNGLAALTPPPEGAPPPSAGDNDRLVIERLLSIVEASANRQTAAIETSANRQTAAIEVLGKSVGERLDTMQTQVGRLMIVALIAPLIFAAVIGTAALGVGLMLRSQWGNVSTVASHEP